MQNKLLIIDDDKSFVKLLICILNAKLPELKVSYSTNGELGLKKIFNLLPDLILLDLKIDNISGYDIIKTIKLNSKTNNISIIVITGKKDENVLSDVLQLGADYFIQKPFEEDELISKIDVAFRNLIRYNKTLYQNVELNRKLGDRDKQLLETQIRYKDLINSIADPIYIFHKESLSIVECNEAMQKKYGYSTQEMKNLILLDLVKVDEAPKVMKNWNLHFQLRLRLFHQY